jgi:hypothetical protein
MFPDEIALRALNAKRCAALYDELRTRPSARTGRPLAADTHRNVLAQAKSFLAWCVKRGWIAADPLASVVHAYAAPGAAAAGDRRRGLTLLNGGAAAASSAK